MLPEAADKTVPDPSPMPAPRRRSGARGAVLGLKVIATTTSLAVVLGSGWAWATYRDFSSGVRRIHLNPKSSVPNIDGADQNILIVGNDDRDSATPNELVMLGTTGDGGSYNTDTMMLLHVPADGRKATVISFPRDSYVAIPGHPKQKLNAAYPLGMKDAHGDKAAGVALLEETLQNLTGLRIDHFVQVDLLGFYRIANALNGVDVCLTHGARPARFPGDVGPGIDAGTEPDGTFVPTYTHIDLPPGHSTIKGLQALAFVRQRHGLGSDLDRIRRQQYFLAAAFRKLADRGTLLNPFALQHLLDAVKSSLVVDDALDLMQLTRQLQNLSAGNVSFTTIPTSGTRDVDGVGNVVVIDQLALPGFIDRLIGRPAKPPVSPASVTVTVVNDTDVNGLEQAAAAALRARGFHTVVPPATAEVTRRSLIEYPAGAEAAARAVAAVVPGAAPQQSRQVSAVTLVLGNDGVRVVAPQPSGGSSRTTGPQQPGTAGGDSFRTAAQTDCIN